MRTELTKTNQHPSVRIVDINMRTSSATMWHTEQSWLSSLSWLWDSHYYRRRLYSRRHGQGVQSSPYVFMYVCLFVCPRSKGQTAWAISTKLGTHML